MKSILVCDDEKDVLKVIVMTLEEGLEDDNVIVNGIDNSVDAMIKITEEKFDLVITDHNMPTMTGTEFIYNMKTITSSKNKDTPIFVLSGYIPKVKDLLDIDSTLTLISKPFDNKDLIGKVKKALNI